MILQWIILFVLRDIDFFALGDSYTIGQSVEESDRWPLQLVKKLNERGYSFNPLQIIAKTEWKNDQLKEAIAEYFKTASRQSTKLG